MDPSSVGQPQDHDQWLIILVGVVGSGKSTLSQAITRQLPSWRRVCQDDLGDRFACESMVKAALSQGLNVIVDRQNFDVQQRRTWLEIAASFPRVRVGGWVLATTPEECARRLRVRQNHPTIHDPQLALELLDKFLSLWVKPDISEGFDHLVTLPSLPPPLELDPIFLDALLRSLAGSPRNPMATQQRQPRPRRGYIPPNRGPGYLPGQAASRGPCQPPITGWLEPSQQGQGRRESPMNFSNSGPPTNSWSRGSPPSIHAWGQGQSLQASEKATVESKEAPM